MASPAIERPARIVVVRSAECPASQSTHGMGTQRQVRHARGAGMALTERGVAQAEAAARYLQQEEPGFDAVFVSPWRRAQQTLDLLLRPRPAAEREALLRECRPDERLRDRDLGITAALGHWDIAARYPDEAQRYAMDGPYYYRPAGGESWADVSLRCFSILNTIFRDRADQRVLVVTHGIVALSIHKILERLDDDAIVRLAREDPPAPGAITSYQPLPGQAEAGRMALVSWAAVPYGPELASELPGVEQAEAALEPMDTN